MRWRSRPAAMALRTLVGALLTLSSSSFHSPLIRSSSSSSSSAAPSFLPRPLCAPLTAAEDANNVEDAAADVATTDADDTAESSSSSRSDGGGGGGKDGDGGGRAGRPLSPDPRLAELGYVRETMEEYDARRAATVQEYGGRVDKPETAAQYAARRRRNEKEKAARMARNAAYEAACGGPLPGRDFAEVQNGEVLSGCTFVSELHVGKGSNSGPKNNKKRGSSSSSGSSGSGQERPKAWFDAGLWRRRASDGLPVKVHACVRLWREDPAEVAYFFNDKSGRAQRLYVTDAQHASGRLVASFSSPDGPFARGGGRSGNAPALQEGESLLEDLTPGTALPATVIGVTKHAAWLSVPVRRRCARRGGAPPSASSSASSSSASSSALSSSSTTKEGEDEEEDEEEEEEEFVYRKVSARLHDRDLEGEESSSGDGGGDEGGSSRSARSATRKVILSSQRVRGEDVERVVSRGDSFTVYVKAVYPDSAKFDVCLDEAAARNGDEARAAAQQGRKRERRRRARRIKATERLLNEGAAAGGGGGGGGQEGSAVERTATVVRVERYGLLVDVGATANGLVHVSDVAKADWVGKQEEELTGGSAARGAFVEDLTKLVPKGQRLVVRLKTAAGSATRPKLSFEIARWLGGEPVDPSFYEEDSDGGPGGHVEDAGGWEEFANSMTQEDDDEEEEEEEEEDLDDKWESRFFGDEAY